MWNLSPRVLKALRRAGLAVEINGAVLRIFDCNRPPCSTPVPEVLLPEGHRLDTKALKQLVDFASTHHPQGGVVLKALATPDFHAGSGVPVGCVLVTSPELVIPDAIGTDINCGMRLHAVDLTLSELNAQRDAWLPALRSDLLLGTRDLPMTVRQIRALLRGGPLAWIEAVRR